MVTMRLAEKPFGSNPSSTSKFLEQIHSKGYYGFFPNENWIPNVNLYETESTYLVCVDLAGMDKTKVGLEVVNGRLTIRGNRPVPTCDDVLTATPSGRVRLHLMEIDHGAFARDVELPEGIKQEEIHAKYINGMLWIEVPKKA
ncbi:MAG: Hsp20/alpha crystallin family protein [Planctomycetota bacterium]|nr:Hsp20/alpha crystallin family protein [Planctomycetota bacterium]